MRFLKVYMFVVPFIVGFIVFFILCGVSLASQEGEFKSLSKDLNVIGILSSFTFFSISVLLILLRSLYIMIKQTQFDNIFEFQISIYSKEWQKIRQPIINEKLTKKAKELRILMDSEETLRESSSSLHTEIYERVRKLSDIQAEIKRGKKEFWQMYHLAQDFGFTVLRNLTEYQKL